MTVAVIETDWPVRLIPRLEEFYRLWCVVVCDVETTTTRRLVLEFGCWGTGGKIEKNFFKNIKIEPVK